MESKGGLAVPREWLQDGTLPLPLAEKLSKLSIPVAIQSGSTLPRGLKGTGKLVFPDSFDGTNPWPNIPKDMLPYVLTGAGTIILADGTWPLHRLGSDETIIPIKNVARISTDVSEPVQPDSQPVMIPWESTKASPDGVNPADLPLPGVIPLSTPEVGLNPVEPINPDGAPPTDVNPLGPSKVGPDPVNPDVISPTDVNPVGPSEVGPDPVNPDDRINKGCCCGH